MILKPGSEGDLIEEELRQSMTSAGDENSQLAAYNAQLNTHFDAAASRTKNARKWLLEVEPHRFTHDLIERIQGFMQPLVEHETHLESIKDGVADHNARIMHLFTATVSSMCIGPQWKKLKSEVDEVMGRSPYVFDDSSFEVSEEEEEEEEMREDEEEVESSAETPEERLARKRLELSAEDDDQSLSALRRSSRLAEVKTAQEKVSVKAKVRPKGSSATAKTKGGGTGSLAAAKTKGKGKESSAAAKTKGGGGKNKSSAKASKGEKERRRPSSTAQFIIRRVRPRRPQRKNVNDGELPCDPCSARRVQARRGLHKQLRFRIVQFMSRRSLQLISCISAA